MRDAFGEILAELGARYPALVVVDVDVAEPTRAHRFWAAYPDRFVQMGVAEQNAVSFAAGLSTLGCIPLVNIFACFAARRAGDQVAISVAYPHLNVKIVGSYAGITTPNTGATHQSVEDVAVMRAMPNMIVLEAADRNELRQVLPAILEHQGPAYLRIVRCSLPDIVPPDYRFSIGKGALLREGTDVTLIGAGLMVSRCLEAAEALNRDGISAMVINMSSLKPIDRDLILVSARHTGAVVTAENHSVIGGLGSAVAETLAEGCPVPLERVGLRDTFGESGKLPELLEKYGLNARSVVEAARRVLSRKPGRR
jgi:transketolase